MHFVHLFIHFPFGKPTLILIHIVPTCHAGAVCAGARSRKRPLLPAAEGVSEGAPLAGGPVEGRKSEPDLPARSGSPARQLLFSNKQAARLRVVRA